MEEKVKEQEVWVGMFLEGDDEDAQLEGMLWESLYDNPTVLPG